MIVNEEGSQPVRQLAGNVRTASKRVNGAGDQLQLSHPAQDRPAGSMSVLFIVFGPALVPSLALVVLVGWSRVRLGDHTIGQVVAGALAGILLAVPTFLLIS